MHYTCNLTIVLRKLKFQKYRGKIHHSAVTLNSDGSTFKSHWAETMRYVKKKIESISVRLGQTIKMKHWAQRQQSKETRRKKEQRELAETLGQHWAKTFSDLTGLGRWLSGYKHQLLFQRTSVWLVTRLTPYATLTPGDPLVSSGPHEHQDTSIHADKTPISTK